MDHSHGGVEILIENIEQDLWISILLDVGIGLEINVLPSKFILLGYQMLGEMGCHPEICLQLYIRVCTLSILMTIFELEASRK